MSAPALLPAPPPQKAMPDDGERAENAKRPSIAERLIALVDPACLLVDERDDAYAHIQRADHRELLRVRGGRFRSYLAGALFDQEGKAANGEALAAAINVIEAQARKGSEVTLWNRVARAPDGSIWLDLCDARWRTVRVDAVGWEVVVDPPPMFRRFSHQQALPDPERGGDARALLKFLNVAEGDAILFLASTVAALVPDIPQAILILHGPQGSAKTTAAKLRRALIDPSAVPTLVVRRDVGELVQALDHHYMPLLDNLHSLSDWQSDLLCQAATGGGFSKRELYSDADDVIFSFRRPLLLTGINVPGAAPDLLDRSLLIGLERISSGARREERAMLDAFEKERAVILGGLLDALAGAMRHLDSLVLGPLPRLADFARWAAAAAEALGYGAAAFMAAMQENVGRQVEEVVEDDPVAQAILAFGRGRGSWTGSASELLAALNAGRDERQPEPGWPKRPADLGRRLNVLRPVLADLGVAVAPGRSADKTRGRTWTIVSSVQEVPE